MFYQVFAAREPKIRHGTRDEFDGRGYIGHGPYDVSNALVAVEKSALNLEGSPAG